MATPYLKYLAMVVAFFSVILYGIGTDRNEFTISESFAVSKHDLFQFLIVSESILIVCSFFSDRIFFLSVSVNHRSPPLLEKRIVLCKR